MTLVNTVPSAMAELVRGGGMPASVRTVNLAGEPLPRALADGIYAPAPVERVLQPLRPDRGHDLLDLRAACRGSDGATPTIGRPLANTRAYVLDRALRAGAAWGCRASCYLGGAGAGPRLSAAGRS